MAPSVHHSRSYETATARTSELPTEESAEPSAPTTETVVIGGSYRKAKYAIVESAPNMKSSFHTAQNAMIFGYISFFFMSVP